MHMRVIFLTILGSIMQFHIYAAQAGVSELRNIQLSKQQSFMKHQQRVLIGQMKKAIEKVDLNAISQILETGIEGIPFNVNTKLEDKWDGGFLHYALRWFLNPGLSKKKRTNNEKKLHVLIEFFVKKGIDLDMVDHQNQTVLDVAHLYKNDSVINLLKIYGAHTAQERAKLAEFKAR